LLGHHFLQVTTTSEAVGSFIVKDGRVVWNIEHVWAAEAIGKVPSCCSFHFLNGFSNLLSLCNDILFQSLITLVKEFKFVLVFGFAKTDA
jgi:hypothetical protein